jgi:hypothetical protein
MDSLDGSMWILTRKEIMNKDRIKKMTRTLPKKKNTLGANKENQTPKFLNHLQHKTKALFLSETENLKNKKNKFLSINSSLFGKYNF